MLLPNTRAPDAYQDDHELVVACLDGRQDAWDALVDRYGRLIYSVPRRYGMAEADADDVFQQVFTILYQKLHTLRDHQRLAAWIIRTTHRECYRVGRSCTAAPDQRLERPTEAEPSDEHVDRLETQQLVRQALDQLGGRCQELLTALFLAPGRPDYENIAEQLNMKVGSIGPTRSRCFAKLEKILGRLGFDTDAEEAPQRVEQRAPENYAPI